MVFLEIFISEFFNNFFEVLEARPVKSIDWQNDCSSKHALHRLHKEMKIWCQIRSSREIDLVKPSNLFGRCTSCHNPHPGEVRGPKLSCL